MRCAQSHFSMQQSAFNDSGDESTESDNVSISNDGPAEFDIAIKPQTAETLQKPKKKYEGPGKLWAELYPETPYPRKKGSMKAPLPAEFEAAWKKVAAEQREVEEAWHAAHPEHVEPKKAKAKPKLQIDAKDELVDALKQMEAQIKRVRQLV